MCFFDVFIEFAVYGKDFLKLFDIIKEKRGLCFMDQAKIGAFLSSLRKEKGLTQEALAETIGVTNKTISRWETGKYLPDIEILLLLGDYFGVTVNELLSGERLSDASFRKSSDANIKHIVADNKKRLHKIITLSIVAVTCVTFVFLAVFAACFLINRHKMLHPYYISDQEVAKAYRGSITVAASSEGTRAYTDSESGIGIFFDLPDGYSNDTLSSLYTNEDGEFVRITTCYTDEMPCPTTLALSRYYAQENISKYSDKVNFAYSYNLDAVTVFSSPETIEIAGGCRLLRGYSAIANTNTKEQGEFYKLSGDLNGYVMSSTNSPNDKVWLICIEDNYRLCFITVRDASVGESVDSVSAWIGHVGFR